MEVQADCPWCGTVTMAPPDIRCELEPHHRAQGLCEFTCPVCSRRIYGKTTSDGVTAIRQAGSGRISGLVPFELLESHPGPPLSWDDLLDLQAAIERTSCPQEELVP